MKYNVIVHKHKYPLFLIPISFILIQQNFDKILPNVKNNFSISYISTCKSKERKLLGLFSLQMINEWICHSWKTLPTWPRHAISELVTPQLELPLYHSASHKEKMHLSRFANVIIRNGCHWAHKGRQMIISECLCK